MKKKDKILKIKMMGEIIIIFKEDNPERVIELVMPFEGGTYLMANIACEWLKKTI